MMSKERKKLSLIHWLLMNGSIYLVYVLTVLSLASVDGSYFIFIYCLGSLVLLSAGLLTLVKRKHVLHLFPFLQKLHEFNVQVLGRRWMQWLMVQGLLMAIIGISALLYYSFPLFVDSPRLSIIYVFSFPFSTMLWAVLVNVVMFLEFQSINRQLGRGNTTVPLLLVMIIPIIIVFIYLGTYSGLLTIVDWFII
ncbi:hypothetical protein ABC345_05780 [Shouchella sp. 1P09AA]|uniref:hypothetical protein n=1 Tax=unclassified Shouchella TaxID=2893065 RepID=UPI0039A1623B